ncbi:predicted protein [Sclerotinia sclerotiorum 1980 UF-70]|nr:predicted protein [Sclerotinia sclerotiorum 1980 UF-70]EDN93982.1 predicted protein [Sclerotinia sclerotiorum 1980 UF-70]
MENGDSIQISLLSAPTLYEHKSTSQNHWDVISEWSRLSEGRDGTRDSQQENIGEVENDHDHLISKGGKYLQVQDDVRETGRKTELKFPQFRRGIRNIMFQRRKIVTCIIIFSLVLLSLIPSSAVDLLEYGQYLFEDLLILLIFLIDGL